MALISKIEFPRSLEKAIAFSANFSSILCTALRTHSESFDTSYNSLFSIRFRYRHQVRWIRWLFRVLLGAPEFLTCSILERRRGGKDIFELVTGSFSVQNVEGMYQTKWFLLLSWLRWLLCYLDLQMLMWETVVHIQPFIKEIWGVN